MKRLLLLILILYNTLCFSQVVGTKIHELQILPYPRDSSQFIIDRYRNGIWKNYRLPIDSLLGAAPTILSSLDIYHENIEWTTSRSGTSFNAASSTFKCSGTVSVEATNPQTGDYIDFHQPTSTSPDFSKINYLTFKISSKAAWTTGQKIRLRFYNEAGSAVGNVVVFSNSSYGFKSEVINSCQTIYIPFTAFGNVTGATRFRIFEAIFDASTTIGFYIDDIVLIQSNISPIYSSTMSWDATMRISPDITQDYFSRFNNTTWTLDSMLQMNLHVVNWLDIIGDKNAGREYMLKMHVNDATNSVMGFANSTVVNGRFNPSIFGYTSASPSAQDAGSLSFRGIVDQAADNVGYTQAAIQFVGCVTHNPLDPNAAPLFDLVNKPIFAIGNANAQHFMDWPDGRIQLPTYIGGAHAGTAVNGVGLDVNGYLVPTSTTGGGISSESDPIATAKTITLNSGTGISIIGSATQTIGSNPTYTIGMSGAGTTPNLQQVTDIGHTTTNNIIAGSYFSNYTNTGYRFNMNELGQAKITGFTARIILDSVGGDLSIGSAPSVSTGVTPTFGNNKVVIHSSGQVQIPSGKLLVGSTGSTGGTSSAVIGSGSASGQNSMSVGFGTAAGQGSLSVGNATASGIFAIYVGNTVSGIGTASGTNSAGFGEGHQVIGQSSASFGFQQGKNIAGLTVWNEAKNSLLAGRQNASQAGVSGYAESNILLGIDNQSNPIARGGVALGGSNQVDNDFSVALGTTNQALAKGAVAIGFGAVSPMTGEMARATVLPSYFGQTTRVVGDDQVDYFNYVNYDKTTGNVHTMAIKVCTDAAGNAQSCGQNLGNSSYQLTDMTMIWVTAKLMGMDASGNITIWNYDNWVKNVGGTISGTLTFTNVTSDAAFSTMTAPTLVFTTVTGNIKAMTVTYGNTGAFPLASYTCEFKVMKHTFKS